MGSAQRGSEASRLRAARATLSVLKTSTVTYLYLISIFLASIYCKIVSEILAKGRNSRVLLFSKAYTYTALH